MLRYCWILLALLFVVSCSTNKYQYPKYKPLSGKEKARLAKEYEALTYSYATGHFSFLKDGEQVVVNRSQNGSLPISVVDSLFSFVSAEKREVTKQLVVHYYDKKTLNNATGMATPQTIRPKALKLSKQIAGLDGFTEVFLVRPGADLSRWKVRGDWQEDHTLLMSRHFLPHREIGTLFVVICRDGQFKSYLGETSSDHIATVAKEMQNCGK